MSNFSKLFTCIAFTFKITFVGLRERVGRTKSQNEDIASFLGKLEGRMEEDSCKTCDSFLLLPCVLNGTQRVDIQSYRFYLTTSEIFYKR